MANNPTDIQKAKKEMGMAERQRNQGEGIISEAAEDFREKLESAGVAAREYGEQIREKAGAALDYIENEARSNPFKTASIAFVTGLITALLLTRRN